MALNSFLMTHAIQHEFHKILKLGDGRYLLINRESTEVAPLTGTSTSSSHNLDETIHVLDFTQDGYPRISLDLDLEVSSLRSARRVWDKNMVNKYTSEELVSFDGDGRSASVIGVNNNSSVLSDYDNIIGSSFNGYITETGTSTSLVPGKTFYYHPVIHTPSYVIYSGYADNSAYSNKDTALFAVYDKSGVKQFQFGLAVSTTYDYTFGDIKELSNGNLLVMSQGLGGVCEITTSGSLRWTHWLSNTQAKDFVETPDYIWFHNGSNITRIQRSNGAATVTSTFVSNSDVDVGNTSNYDTLLSPNDSTRISIESDGTIYAASYTTKTAGIMRITNNTTIDAYWDIHGNSDADLSYSRLNSMMLTEDKLLFNAVFTNAAGRGTYHTAVVTGSFNKDTTGTLSADLNLNLVINKTAPFRISKRDVDIDLTFSASSNNTSFDSTLYTGWNSYDVKTDYLSNTNESTVTRTDYSGSISKLQE